MFSYVVLGGMEGEVKTKQIWVKLNILNWCTCTVCVALVYKRYEFFFIRRLRVG